MTELGYHIASLAARRLPVWLTDRMATWLADAYVSTHPTRAKDADLRVARIWREAGRVGQPPPARETFRAFAWAFRDFLAARGGGARVPAVRMDEEAAAHLAAARAAALPTLVVSGHFGPWEMALWWLAREVGPMDAITAPHRLEPIERFFRARRAAFGVRTLGGRSPTAEAVRKLRGGGWVAALADRSWGGRASRAVAPGGLVRVDTAPLILAQRAHAQVLPGVAWRAPDGMIAVRFHAPFTLDSSSPSTGGLSIDQGAATVRRFFDDHVRAHPTQWFHWSVRAPRGSSR
ncbi:MAG TPA: hypothetical protein VK123_07805 [Candidatus Limnocylindrales bacterium]|nr:hypothetical protein [Candidatus Limnocylindrales bacterium]